ncbi:MAG: cation-translocating P-type ATPase [Anaerolineae bacterium]
MSHACHTISADEAARVLGSDPQRGLSQEEAARRLQQIGPNELAEKPRPSIWTLLLGQFNNFLIIILLVASIISILLGEFIDAGAIIAIVVLNAVLGVVQESKAEEALAALKKMAAPEAHVLRDGHLISIPAREVVPGDVVVLETGNYVPADVRLVESANLRIEEASLTGESVPAKKDAGALLPADAPLGDRRNMAFMGTLVTYGRGRGIVVATGMRTQIGRIAAMIQEVEEEPTPLQQKLDQLGKWLGIAALVICGVVFLVGVLRGISILEMFMTAVSLAIAAVPEGLPAVVTICLALGMQRMIQRHALIRRLPAVETLGSATTICSDKTGTLTQNEMTVVQVWADNTLLNVMGEGYRPEGDFMDREEVVDPHSYPAVDLLLRGMLLCNDARLEAVEASDNGGRPSWRIAGDPTEGALVVLAAKAGYWKDEMERLQPRLAEIPFDSGRKRMTTIHPNERGNSIAFVKGAPDIILQHATHIYVDGVVRELTDFDRERILEVNASLASNALRVLALAYRELDEVPAEPTPELVEKDLIFVGLVGMIDPARAEVRDAIRVARQAGIRPVMITGDYPNTAVAIAKDLHLLRPQGKVLTGVELDRISDEEFVNIVENVDVFARVSPEHKVRIVEALRKRGHIVSMTGDGVNDAPALKRADIGVAMGITGTDVSKQTADMVLTDDNFASIVAAVEEGRIIYSNIRKFVYYLLSCNVGEILVIFLATIAGLPLPLTAIQLLMLNLLTDGAPALALGVERGDPDIMQRPPRPVDEPVINREMLIGIGVQAIAITAATLTAFLIGLRAFPDNLAGAQTMAFATLSLSELFRAYAARSERYSVFSIGIFSNKYMQYAFLVSLAILLAIIYIPVLDPIFDTTFLGWEHWAEILPLVLIPAAAAEVTKWFLRQGDRRRRPVAEM